ncbi:MAG: hypothetical protein CM1200mP26_29150 [Acidimicrobiales bacterium]|nr:MAG: hypothetical protein CM1200mP26_29150 [Acidimicrobiales bacterium]
MGCAGQCRLDVLWGRQAVADNRGLQGHHGPAVGQGRRYFVGHHQMVGRLAGRAGLGVVHRSSVPLDTYPLPPRARRTAPGRLATPPEWF